jgi:mono/diheme cytochrome c family protein/glucose/arabinose dehydrogenase
MKTPLAVLALLVGATSALALNKGNAGPKDVTLKFNLPAPAPLSPEEALKSFRLPPGFRIELVASEPMIETPVAISFDDQGRMFVVEMRGYMRDVDGTTEKEPIGRVSLLTDVDGDGRMDSATAFADNLVMPRGVMPVKGGALIAEPPNLFFCRDLDGDGKAETRTVVANDYGTFGGQPEHMANTPTWAMDNRIYSAGYGVSFRALGDAWQRGPGLGRGQWGLCQDDAGRLFFNYNSDLLRADLLPAAAFARNPLLRTASSINYQVMKDQAVFPSHPTPGVNRGYDPKTLREDGTLARATSTCGAVVYRGDAFPAEYRGDAFVPEPSSNLIKRLKLTEKDGVITAEDAHPGQEFLTSTDERFRPVMMANGPDGALYVVDMYRGMLQHPGFLTHYLMANIKARKLETPVNQGRIWRIVRDDQAAPKATKLTTEAAARVKLLKHPNGWVRDTAQRLLVESGDPITPAPALRALLTDADATDVTRLHALWTLDGLGAIAPDDVRAALKDKDAQVRAAAVRLASADLLPDLLAVRDDPAPLVLAHLAIRLSSVNQPSADQALAELVARHGHHALVREGTLSGVRGRETTIAQAVAAVADRTNVPQTGPVLEALATLVSQAGKAGPFEQMLGVAVTLNDRTNLRDAVLRGLDQTIRDAKTKKTTPLKTIWLSSEPAALAKLRTTVKSSGGLTNLTSLSSRLAWMGKPGAPAPPKVTALTKAEQARFEKGKTIFTSLCAPCHQPHGYGLDGLAPPLVDSDWVLGKPDVTAKIVLNGLGGPIKVGNRTWDLSMPPMGMLSDEDVASVLTYIRREWDHNGSPVDAKFVAGVRKQSAGHPNSWTADELRPPTKKAVKAAKEEAAK